MILFFVFGTLPAVLIPLAVAIASILNTFTLVWILTYVTNVSIIVQFLIALVGLGVAIDYALLMIFRFRDELREGEDVETALVETMTHAGRSVIVSGLDRRRRPPLDARAAAAVHPLDRDRRHADPGGLGDRGDHAAAGPARVARDADQQRPAAAEALRRPRPSGGRPVGPLGRASSCAGPCRSPRSGSRSSALLVFYGVQLNPSEAQAKDFPGTGDAIDGRGGAGRRGHLAPA